MTRRAALLFLLLLVAAAASPGCGFFSYRLSRIERDEPIDEAGAGELRVGETRFAEAVRRLGAPHRVSFVFDGERRRTTRLEWFHAKERSSDVVFHVPREEAAAYNSGVRFFLVFLRAMRGESVLPAEVDRVPLGGAGGAPSPPTAQRYSTLKASGEASGHGLRLSTLRDPAASATGDVEEAVRPLEALALAGDARGRDVLRLEFDDAGILTARELGRTTPGTALLDQVRESVLQ